MEIMGKGDTKMLVLMEVFVGLFKGKIGKIYGKPCPIEHRRFSYDISLNLKPLQ
jgi:hypothetical protein